MAGETLKVERVREVSPQHFQCHLTRYACSLSPPVSKLDWHIQAPVIWSLIKVSAALSYYIAITAVLLVVCSRLKSVFSGADLETQIAQVCSEQDDYPHLRMPLDVSWKVIIAGAVTGVLFTGSTSILIDGRLPWKKWWLHARPTKVLQLLL